MGAARRRNPKVAAARKGKPPPKATGNCRNYRYGAHEPIANLDKVLDEMRGAHDLRNVLTCINRARSEMITAALGEHQSYKKATADLAALHQRRDKLEAQIRQQNSASRKRLGRHSPLSSELDTVRKRIDEGRTALKKLRRKLLKKDPALKAVVEAADDMAKRETTRAEDACGLYWCTRNEQTGKRAKLRRFKKWRDSEATISVQIPGGLTVEQLLGGENNQARLELRPEGVWVQGARKRKVEPAEAARNKLRLDEDGYPMRKLGTAILHLRCMSDEDGKPIWAEVPITYHREIPADAKIKRCYLHRFRVGNRYHWSVRFSLERGKKGDDSWLHPRVATTGTAAIDIGWRWFPDRLRVAVWAGSDGAEGELCLPKWWLDEMYSVRLDQRERDVLFNEIVSLVLPWFRSRRGELSDYVVQAIKTMHSWRDKGRLAALSMRWRDDLAADPGANPAHVAMSIRLEEWRKRDKHIWCEEVNLRSQLQGSRKDLYRRFAAMLTSRYGRIVVEEFDLSAVQKLPPASIDDGTYSRVKRHKGDAACSHLVGALKDAARQLDKKNPKWTTKRCHVCGKTERKWENPGELEHTCKHCGVLWDRDVNAARNILAASGVAVDWTRPPLAPAARMTYPQVENREMRRSRRRKEALETTRASGDRQTA